MPSPRTVLFALLAATSALAPAAATPLLKTPAVSATEIAFSYAGDLWIIGRDGGDARRLTSGDGVETDPVFSPDGRWIAFTGESAGNLDVYLVAAAGGVPRRLTWHPARDRAVGWTPDGGRVLFRSDRNSPARRYDRLFTVAVAGGLPAELPLPMGEQGCYSPDGGRLAYVPYWNRHTAPGTYLAWKRYRGGMTSPIWIARLDDSTVEAVPRDNSNDFAPMWVGDRIYFLSDRNGPTALYVYDPVAKRVDPLPVAAGGDILAAAAAPGAIVYERLGELRLFDLAARRDRALAIAVRGDLPAVRPRFANVTRQIRAAALSPTGLRALFEAHGEILTVPAEKGDVRDLTRTPGVAERSPAWSPDGRRIAWFSDESGEYALHVADQSGAGPVQKIDLGTPPSFYYAPRWSPDGTRIAYTDKRLTLWYVDLREGRPVRVDADFYDSLVRRLDPSWSPDGRFLAYTRLLRNQMHAVFVYSLADGKSRQVTDGMSDALYAAFDRGGRHLYFTASTDAGPTTGWLDLSSLGRAVSRSVYVVVLARDQPSPLAPQSDEEPPREPGRPARGKGEGKEKEKEAAPAAVRIDFDGIGQRILALPVPARAYSGLYAGKPGEVFLLESPPVKGFGAAGRTVRKFSLEKRQDEVLLEKVGADSEGGEGDLNAAAFALSDDGEKMLYRRGDEWSIAATAEPPKPDHKPLALDALEVQVDPRAEWRQMFRETWRIERDFFYDPGLHGLDLAAAIRHYEPYLDDLGHRADLTYLFADMLGELTVGHMFIDEGGPAAAPKARGGLLGADFRIENGRYRFARIYDGENWNPGLQAPLTQPGVDVRTGEYLLAIDGHPLAAEDEVYRLLDGTAGRQVVLEVGPDPGGRGAREVTVVPVDSEARLRNLAWIEDNRRTVDRLSGGRLAYVYMPDTGENGLASFNRYFFAQIDRAGVVLDERANGGGSAADYVIDYLRRTLLSYWTTREGNDFRTPVGAIFGPKVMVVDGFAGSGGDAMPWYFRRTGLGPLVGTRTWGGLIGIFDYPELLDGGHVTAPRIAVYSPEGAWEVENHGVAPDVEVQLDPHAWRQGHDPQLEKAVAVALAALAKNPPPAPPKKPAYPNYHRQ
jgi:tricorn protease